MDQKTRPWSHMVVKIKITEKQQRGEVNSSQHKKLKDATKANLCRAYGSSTHKRSTHRDCPFNSAAIVDSEDEDFGVTAGSPAPSSESDFDVFGVSGPCLPSIAHYCKELCTHYSKEMTSQLSAEL